jgi:hypothetical protein
MNDVQVQPPVLPIPYYPSRRLLGIELEYDAAGAAFHKPTVPVGWVSKPDGSIHNGEEYVLEPPLPVIEAKEIIDVFSQEVTRAKMHVSKAGGYHIHVQAHDYSLDDATRLVQIYWRYQAHIDLLVAPSRRSGHNTQTSVYDEGVKPTKEFLVDMFQLNNPAPSRPDAKLTRQKMVINLAMLRCRRAVERSIEFRQPSPSKKLVNIYGWAVLAVGLVEFAKNGPVSTRFINVRNPSWRTFLAMCRRIERLYGARDLVAWVKWRRDYLNVIPTDKSTKLYEILVNKPHGIFHIARKLNINLAAALKLVKFEVHKGRLIEAAPSKWRVKYDSVAILDAQRIIAMWSIQERPAQRTAAPTVQSTAPVPAILVQP